MMSHYVYWKSAHAGVRASATDTAQSVGNALAAMGFTVARTTGRLSAERPGRLPGLPFTYVWTAQIERGVAGQTNLSIEYGLRATLGTWIALAVTVALFVPLIFLSQAAPALMMIPMAPLLWLFGAVIAMKVRQGMLERRLWQALRQDLPVTAFATSVRAVE